MQLTLRKIEKDGQFARGRNLVSEIPFMADSTPDLSCHEEVLPLLLTRKPTEGEVARILTDSRIHGEETIEGQPIPDLFA